VSENASQLVVKPVIEEAEQATKSDQKGKKSD